MRRPERRPIGHAGVQRGHKRGLAILAGRPPELGTQHVERVTGIEPALSAWESDRSGLLTALTWTSDAPSVTVMDPATPWLMARGVLVTDTVHRPTVASAGSRQEGRFRIWPGGAR